MTKVNQIKVFRPRSKSADFTIRCVKPEAGVKKVKEYLTDVEAQQVRSAFRSLKALGAESLVFRTNGRKIKVEAAMQAC